MPSSNLSDLTSETQAAARSLLDYAQSQGIDVMVTQTLRTCAEQNELYSQGRTQPGGVVTNAPGCRSWHTHGRALDLLVRDNGKVVSNGLDARYAQLGEYARTLGFKWGGDFGDYGHFEFHPGLTIEQVCPRPDECASVPSADLPPQSAPATIAFPVGAAVAALSLGVVAYIFADIRWDLTSSMVQSISRRLT